MNDCRRLVKGPPAAAGAPGRLSCPLLRFLTRRPTFEPDAHLRRAVKRKFLAVVNSPTAFVVFVVFALAMLVGLTGCDGNQQKDLTGVTFTPPDKAEGYQNVDGQPNLTRLCIGGVAFLTSSRQDDAVLRVPEWDAWCKAK